MRGYCQLYARVILVCLALVSSAVVNADGELDKASAALTGILFEFSAEEFTSYSIKENGWVDITFARNTPDALYSQILGKLESHPDIKGVLAGKGGPSCPLF